MLACIALLDLVAVMVFVVGCRWEHANIRVRERKMFSFGETGLPSTPVA